MNVWVVINCGEFGAIFDMQVFQSQGAAKSYVRSKKNADSYTIEKRKVQKMEDVEC